MFFLFFGFLTAFDCFRKRYLNRFHCSCTKVELSSTKRRGLSYGVVPNPWARLTTAQDVLSARSVSHCSAVARFQDRRRRRRRVVGAARSNPPKTTRPPDQREGKNPPPLQLSTHALFSHTQPLFSACAFQYLFPAQ